MTMRLARTGLHDSGKEPPAGVEHGIGQSGGAVEEDLDQEHPGEHRADPLDQVGIDALLSVHRVQPEDQRGGEHGKAVSTAIAVRATVITTLVAFSSSVSRNSVNSGTRVAESTPPMSSS